MDAGIGFPMIYLTNIFPTMVNWGSFFFSVLLLLSILSCEPSISDRQVPVALWASDTLTNYSVDPWGAIDRGDSTQPRIRLLFTGHEYADGVDSILHILENHGIKGYFFFTGDFIRAYPLAIQKIKDAGHYIGCHSNRHLLYADWIKRDSLLVTHDAWKKDLDSNYLALKPFGIERADHQLFMAPYEWYNQSISKWCKQEGLTLLNFSPGLITQADYTVPDDKNYRSTMEIVGKTLQNARNGALNGAFLLIHVGSSPYRTNKLYWELDTLLTELEKMGYQFQVFP